MGYLDSLLMTYLLGMSGSSSFGGLCDAWVFKVGFLLMSDLITCDLGSLREEALRFNLQVNLVRFPEVHEVN